MLDPFPNLSSLQLVPLPSASFQAKGRANVLTHLATVSKSFLYTQGAMFSSALAFTEKLQFLHAYRRTLELLSDWDVRGPA
jgi:hypothetical protein